MTAEKLKALFLIQILPQLQKQWHNRQARAVAGFFVLIFVLVCATYKHQGISWNEPLHDDYGQAVADYFASGFADKGFLRLFNVYLYGAAADLLVWFIRAITPLDGIEGRHFVTAMFGLFGLYGTYRLGRQVGGFAVGFVAMVMLALMPSWYGHMFINPKDIPFAAAHVWAIVALLACIRALPRPKALHVAGFGVAAGIMMGIRVGGGVVAVYAVFALAWAVVLHLRQSRNIGQTARFTVRILLFFAIPSAVLALGLMIAFWPWAHENTFARIAEALSVFGQFPWSANWHVAYLGRNYWVDTLPPHFLGFYFLYRLPEFVWPLVVAGAFLGIRAIFARKAPDSSVFKASLLVIAALFVPVYAIVSGAAFHGGLHHFLFVLPVMGVLCAWSAVAVYNALGAMRFSRYTKPVFGGLLVFVGVTLVWRMVLLHPYQYVFFNRFIGGLNGTQGGVSQLDYWALSYHEAVQKLHQHIVETKPDVSPQKPAYVSVCIPESSAVPFMSDHMVLAERFHPDDYHIMLESMNCAPVTGEKIFSVMRDGVALSSVYRTGRK